MGFPATVPVALKTAEILFIPGQPGERIGQSEHRVDFKQAARQETMAGAGPPLLFCAEWHLERNGTPMKKRGEIPSPEKVSFMLMDSEKGTAVPIDRIPREEWLRLRAQIMWSVGRGISELYAKDPSTHEEST